MLTPCRRHRVENVHSLDISIGGYFFQEQPVPFDDWVVDLRHRSRYLPMEKTA